MKWLGTKAEERGIEIYPGFAAHVPLFDGKRVVGVQIQDRGVDKDGKHKGVFEPGPEIYAKCVIFGEGTRGSCTKVVIDKLGLQGPNPQAYETGIKEIWRIKPENHVPGRVVHTMGWPQDPTTFGGGWIYDLKDNCVSIGFVTGLDYDNPYTDPHDLMQRWKTAPAHEASCSRAASASATARRPCRSAATSRSRSCTATACMLIGDSAGTCNGERLKGVHLAIKSGMLAAETLVEAIRKDDYSEATLAALQDALRRELAREGALQGAQLPRARSSTCRRCRAGSAGCASCRGSSTARRSR